jgi:hypothetical protein
VSFLNCLLLFFGFIFIVFPVHFKFVCLSLHSAFYFPTLNALPPALNLTNTSQSTFPALASMSPTELYLVMFGMLQLWSYVGQVLKGNKENVVTIMVKLSLNDDVGSGKLGSGPKKTRR